MDRNFGTVQVEIIIVDVALRKESVDRNNIVSASFRAYTTSLSARRAWIEILLVYLALIRYLVALRKESVDRNTNFLPVSLFDLVALRKESVDRN